jgi:TatD family-associated radical SAM protein
MKPAIVYKYKNNLYINITNRCPVKCSYCIKFRWKKLFRGYNLGLDKEPSFKEICNELEKKLVLYPDIKEIIFCGYGEPLLRWKIVKKVALWIKKNYFNKYKIRVNTNGLANAWYKMNICKHIKDYVDSISVSLNAHNEEVYLKLHRTNINKPFDKIIKFIKQAKKDIKEVIVTTIAHPMIDVNKVRTIAKQLGVKFKLRKYLTSYERK